MEAALEWYGKIIEATPEAKTFNVFSIIKQETTEYTLEEAKHHIHKEDSGMNTFNQAIQQVKEWLAENQNIAIESDVVFHKCCVVAHRLGIYQRSFEVWEAIKQSASRPTSA